jgi:aspartyl protease family protein
MADERGGAGDLSTGLKWGPLGIVLFWLVVMGLLYLAMNHYLKPAPAVVTASGDLVIPKSRNGHFHVAGEVNGQPVNFMVDTGASLVVVSEAFARRAGLPDGVPITFRTANGELPGRVVQGVPVTVGPVAVSAVRVGVGLVGGAADDALLGQSFLSQFDITLGRDEMVLRRR